MVFSIFDLSFLLIFGKLKLYKLSKMQKITYKILKYYINFKENIVYFLQFLALVL